MKALIQGWRSLWTAGDFPFYYVQIAPYRYGDEVPAVLARFWDAQRRALEIPHTGMAVIHDVGNMDDIHPKNKQEVGRRLALWALADTYGFDDMEYSGPLFRDMRIRGHEIYIRFEHARSGLTTRDQLPPDGFEIIDAESGGYVEAVARIKGDSVVLSAPGVDHPIAVRFAWHKLASPNLMNVEGLPASAFRAGHEPVRDLLEMEIPEAAEYRLVYDLDLAHLDAEIHYDADHSSEITGPFDRIAYFVELASSSGEVRYVFVSMAAFTDDLQWIGVPTHSSGAYFQQAVQDMNIRSNAGIFAGTGLHGGRLEFWPNNYGTNNAAEVPGASSRQYDFGDESAAAPADGYGSMQIHNVNEQQTIFALNHWRQGETADIGIGNRGEGHPDWTFAGNAAGYSTRRLRVLVRTTTAR